MTDNTINQSSESRKLRYKRLNQSAEYAQLTNHSVKSCMRHAAGGQIKLMVDPVKNRAFYSGLITCGSVWDCPVCAAKISARRAEEIQGAIEKWYSMGGTVAMITYTIRHNLGDSLKSIANTMTDAIRFVHSGAPYARIKDKYKISGSISATEVLYNVKNGWHYHKHQVIFIEGNQLNNQDLQDWITKRYNRYLLSNGFSSLDGIGVVVSEIESIDNISGYVNKWGLQNELTAYDKKSGSGFTPFELLDDPAFKDRWLEYSVTMYARRRITWSNGLRKLLDLGAEIPDEDLIEEIEATEVVIIDDVVWAFIVKNNMRATLLDMVEVSRDDFLLWFRKIQDLAYKSRKNQA